MEISKLSKIIDLCRKKGVESIEIEGIKISLNPAAPAKRPYKKNQNSIQGDIETSEPSREELLFWSAQELPGAMP